MISTLIFIGVILGINIISYLIPKEYPILKSRILKLVFLSSILFLAAFILSMNGINLKGLYAYKAIGIIMIVSSLSFIVLEKILKSKIVANFLLLPLIVLSGLNSILYNKIGTYKLDESLSLIVSREGFLGCGEIIRLTKSKLIIFDQELIYDSNQCLIGIENVEILKMNEHEIELLIYHNGTMDSENPYRYKLENDNLW